ncbi:MAG: mtDNA inheritance, partitioning of the mitochondrial organelle [Thelocarpon impressellum]|nr:MAG: mtDNA inheritance, partitioning of the mitochondrial organelle [Thelocarpon impressellum]
MIKEAYFTYSTNEISPVAHDVSFRSGIGADGSETFTPRTLIYDLKGGFGSMRKINALYDMQEEPGLPKGLWDGASAVQRLPSIEESPYQRSLNEGSEPPQLTSSTVRYWSDFNRVFYHPRSIIQLNEYELNSSLMPFEKWDAGEELFSSLDREHDILDRDLRPFAEECDQLQGLQVMTGADDAWAGFAARYVDRLRDEYGKTNIWIWGLEDGRKMQREKRLQKSVNAARAFHDISSQASMYIPIADPPSIVPADVDLDPGSEWSTSALLSSAIETMTLPSRLRAVDGARVTLDEMELALNTNGKQRIARLRFSPCADQARPESYGRGMMEGGSHEATAGLSTLDIDLFPDLDLRERKPERQHTFGQVEVVRGERERPAEDEDEEVLEGRRRRAAGLPVVKIYRTPLVYPLPDSFPSIYRHTKMRPSGLGTLAAHAALGTSSAVAGRLEAIRRVVERMVGLDEREALSNGLAEMSEAYGEGWAAESDSGED